MASEGRVWEDLRREARSIERRLESGIQRYTALETRYDLENPKSFQEDEQVEGEIEVWLARMAELIQGLDACEVSGRSANKAQIQRLREILFDYKSEFRNAQSKKNEQRQRRMLLKQVDEASSEDKTAEDLLLQEKYSISNSHKAADAILGQAGEVSSTLRNQRNTFTNATSRLSTIGKAVPGVETLMKRIQNKRTRDNTILAIVIALCICFILFYVLNQWF
mmetsp:Transcript_9876/g.11285  ORF Transcript_9876/g.11285 Transcript_9876/m.11285 type:complete len:222 (-) Transcript_9876:1068-1733(-)|eukprot:CAMPEP_0184026934 /NCGR_PEP_ID=MMETSP0954-20121128/13856_1 /TAXON_ID=627963 /ORGANISM="Aplanochytrium sp, Strain PBS07" /LENGTH=221 /DNA_ID=CAMNT_0026311313 /DNA_START=182 /DNA_END=847 /DNA_ORIENTATION=+